MYSSSPTGHSVQFRALLIQDCGSGYSTYRRDTSGRDGLHGGWLLVGGQLGSLAHEAASVHHHELALAPRRTCVQPVAGHTGVVVYDGQAAACEPVK